MQDDLLAIPFRIYAMMVMFLQTLVNVCLRRLRPASTQLGPHACRVPRTQPEATGVRGCTHRTRGAASPASVFKLAKPLALAS